MKSIVLLSLCLALSGCGSAIKAIEGYTVVAQQDYNAVNDLRVKGLKFALCDMPMSVIIKNPELKLAVIELCAGAKQSKIFTEE